MANHSGLSQASNISGISSVSRSTSIRGPIKADYSIEGLDKAFIDCREIIADYAIKKLIYECVKEVSSNRDKILAHSTANKLRELLKIHEIEKYLHLPNLSSDVNERMTLLGITDLPKIDLNYEEKLDIKKLVEKKLREQSNSFLARFTELGGNIEELTKKNESLRLQQVSEIFDSDMLQWKEKIEQECTEYEKDILVYKQYFSEWIDLKYSDMNDIQLKKAESLLIKVQVSETQAKITKLNCILKMFKDTPFTLDAYQMMNSNLETQISELEQEIENKKAIKKLYDDLNGTEFDQVVHRYSELCKAIEKKKRIMEDLN